MPAHNFQPLPPQFYAQSTVDLARNLLGKILVFENSYNNLPTILAGKIVETEAYLQSDAASHSFMGKNQRNQMMFENAGTAYIYQIYGLYYCLNVVSGQKEVGEAVLIRAVEPVLGVHLMQKNREKIASKNKISTQKLCNGPAKLTLAFGLNKIFNGHNLQQKPLFIATNGQYKNVAPQEIVATTRIGISKAQNSLLRFYIKNSDFISKK